MRGRWTVTLEEPDWCGLSVEVDGVAERIAIKRTGSGALILFTQVCSQEHIKPLAALGYNQVSERWTLGIWRGSYVLRSALRSAHQEDVGDAIQAAVAEAARLRAGRVSPQTGIHWRADWCA